MKKKLTIVWLIILASAMYISAQYFWLPFSIQMGGIATLFVYVGLLLHKDGFFEKNSYYLAGIIVLLSIVAYSISFKNNWIMNIASAFLPVPAVTLFTGISVSISVIFLCKELSRYNNFFMDKLAWLGRNSLWVLCFHTIECMRFPWDMILDYTQKNQMIPIGVCKVFIFVSRLIFCIIGVCFIKKMLSFWKGKHKLELI